LQDEGLLQLPLLSEDETCASNFHLFYLVMPDLDSRDALIAALKAQGIYAVFHYAPLHSSPMGQKFGYREGDLPLTEDISNRLVRLPLFYEITEQEQSRVVKAVGQFCETVVAGKRKRPAHVVSWRAAV
jgi:dTDP-4-amino-4,6-dideoxygalactose transaminase